MMIRSINVLKGGETLAEPILSDKQDIIIPQGTILKKEYIPLISSMGISTVMVEDPYECYEKPNSIMEHRLFEEYVNRIKRIMERHIYQSNNSLRQCEIIASQLVKEIQQISDNIIIDIKERKSDLYEHTIMVTLLSLILGKKLHYEKERLYNIALGCLLHDLGLRYITIPYENQDLKDMSPASVFEIKKHTILGFSALEGENWIPAISRKMILAHHERADGNGYPMRQKYKESECKIIQVCDTFDRYICGIECKRISLSEIIAKLQKGADSRYDKKIVRMLLDMIATYPVGTTIKTNHEQVGVVISQTEDKNLPMIMIVDEENCAGKEYKKYNLMQDKNISIQYVM